MTRTSNTSVTRLAMSTNGKMTADPVLRLVDLASVLKRRCVFLAIIKTIIFISQATDALNTAVMERTWDIISVMIKIKSVEMAAIETALLNLASNALEVHPPAQTLALKRVEMVEEYSKHVTTIMQ